MVRPHFWVHPHFWLARNFEIHVPAPREKSSAARMRRSRLRGLALMAAVICADSMVRAQSTQPATPVGVTPIPAVAPSEGATPLSSSSEADVTITANRLPTSAAEVGSSVTIITAEEIERKQASEVADVLRGTPGLDVVRSGGPNQITSVFTRGSDSSHTLVLIDGIPANDPTSPSRAFDFSHLTTANVDRIEVLRGPQSTLWGSDALGGVINIITKRGEGPPGGYVFAEGGSFHSYREGAGVSGGNKLLNYSLSVSQYDSQGFSAADAAQGNREPDGFSRSATSGKIGWNISPNLDVDFIFRYNHDNTDLDNFGGPGGDNLSRVLYGDQVFLRAQPHLLLLDGLWEQTFGISYSHYYRRDNDITFPEDTHGGTFTLDWQHDLHLAKNHTLTIGAQFMEENVESLSISNRVADSDAVYVQDAVSFADQLFLTAGVRYEDHSISNSSTTYRLTAAYLFPTHTKLHASYGTGFKSPSLSDLYSSYGSIDLQPERNRGWDVGVEQQLFGDKLTAEATYFRNDFDNLIDFNFVTSKLQNIGAAKAQGVEIGLTARPTRDLTVGINYTYTDTLDQQTNESLLRRPPNKLGLNVDWRYSNRGDVTLSAIYNGQRADLDPVTFGRTRLGDYVLLNLATSYKLTDHLTVFARIDNVLNRHYEEVAGFGTADFSLYGGMKVSF